MNITPRTFPVALIGHPIGHSLSPALHNKMYNLLGLDMVYIAFDVKEENLYQAIQGLRSLGFIGFNVTIPYKEKILPMLDNIDDTASAIGAINTVKIQQGKLIGYNTDGIGFIHSSKAHGVNFKDKQIAILGCGGSARAIGISLVQEKPNQILLYNRTKERAEGLAQSINDYAKKNLALAIEEIPEADIIINTTPLGMWPNTEETPLTDYVFNPQSVICDIVYNPPMTQLLKQAQQSGCTIIGGLGMLVSQGIKANEIWTGHSIDNEILKIMIDDLYHKKEAL